MDESDEKKELMWAKLKGNPEVLKTVEDMNLSPRPRNAYKAANIHFQGQVVASSGLGTYFAQDNGDFYYENIPNFGRKSFVEVEEALKEKGLQFKMIDSRALGIRKADDEPAIYQKLKSYYQIEDHDCPPPPPAISEQQKRISLLVARSDHHRDRVFIPINHEISAASLTSSPELKREATAEAYVAVNKVFKEEVSSKIQWLVDDGSDCGYKPGKGEPVSKNIIDVGINPFFAAAAREIPGIEQKAIDAGQEAIKPFIRESLKNYIARLENL